jgi:class I fructose-bisphosphate aldolase
MAATTERVKQILSWYGSDSPGTLANLHRMLMTGRLAGTGKMVILPVDQGFEHGPARSFAPNPAGYDPDYHFQLAIDSGCNAYAAPLGFIEAGAAKFAGQIPLILKVNSSDSLGKPPAPISAVTSSVKEAVRLGCSAIGYTIYPGSSARNQQYESLRQLTEEAKANGLVVVVWSYPRGEGVSKDGETAVDVAAYAAQIACQLGAHIVKVKPPKLHLDQPEAKKVYEKHQIPIATMADRVRNVVQVELRRQADRHLLRRRGEGDGRAAGRGEGAGRRRRLRLDHGAQRLPASEGRGDQAAERRAGHLRQGEVGSLHAREQEAEEGWQAGEGPHPRGRGERTRPRARGEARTLGVADRKAVQPVRHQADGEAGAARPVGAPAPLGSVTSAAAGIAGSPRRRRRAGACRPRA